LIEAELRQFKDSGLSVAEYRLRLQKESLSEEPADAQE
jgi:hypothetical protein